MGEVVIIGAGDDPIERVRSLLVGKDLDYSANLVVFPGKRPGHYLRRTIGQALKAPYRPPQVLSMDGFVDLLSGEASGTSPLEAIDAVAIIYDLCKGMDSLPKEFMRFDRFYTLGIRLFRILEELYIEEVSVERLREVEALIEIPLKSLEGIRFLSALYERFYRRLAEEGLFTRSMRYRRASRFDRESLDRYERVILAGFFAFTAAERRLVKRLLDMDRVFFLFRKGKGLDGILKDLGIRSHGEEGGSWDGKIKIYTAPDTHGEVYGVGTIVRRMEGLDEETVIVLPKVETLFPLVRQGLSFLDERAYNVSMGYPIGRTPIYGFFTALFDLINSMDGQLLHLPHYLRFMLHPYTKNILYQGRADTTRMILHTMEDLLRDGAPVFADLPWIEKEMSVRIAERLKVDGLGPAEIGSHLSEIHSRTIRGFLGFKSIGDFAARCRDLLLYIYKSSTARLHPLFFPFVEAFIREFDRLEASLVKDLSFEERESYFHFFRRYILSATVPFEGTPLKGLQILGFLETRCIRFRKVLFLDLNEGVFPDLSEDPLLPFQVRKGLGLSTPEDRERFLLYYFDLLLRGAEEVHLFYVKDGRMERSRFLERLLWEMEKVRGRPFRDGEPLIPINYRVGLSNQRPQEISKSSPVLAILRDLVLTPSSIDEYLKCGLRFYYSTILRLKERRGWEVDRAGIGEVVHRALKDYFAQRLNRPLGSGDLRPGEMREVVDRIFKERYGPNLSGRLYLIKVQVERRLIEVLQYYRRLLQEGPLVVLAVEKEIGPLEIDGTPFQCRLDRVEQRGNGIYIVDYKTAWRDTPLKIDFERLDLGRRESWSKAIGSLQMPLYLILYSKATGIPVEQIGGGYLLLGRPSHKWEFLPIPDGQEDKIKLIQQVLRGLIMEMKDPDRPFSPPSDLKGHCPSCDYKALCGTGWIL